MDFSLPSVGALRSSHTALMVGAKPTAAGENDDGRSEPWMGVVLQARELVFEFHALQLSSGARNSGRKRQEDGVASPSHAQILTQRESHLKGRRGALIRRCLYGVISRQGSTGRPSAPPCNRSANRFSLGSRRGRASVCRSNRAHSVQPAMHPFGTGLENGQVGYSVFWFHVSVGCPWPWIGNGYRMISDDVRE